MRVFAQGGAFFWGMALTRQWSGIAGNLSLLVVGLALGLLLSVGWRPSGSDGIVETHRESSAVWPGIERLEAEQRELKTTFAELRQHLSTRQQAAAANTDRLQALKVELDREQLLAGLTPVQGPGVLVILDDSAVRVPPDANPSGYLIHEYDVRDIVHLLWMAGSEAIAINDERLVSTSSIFCVGNTVMVNDTRLSPPYLIRAVGNPRVQQDYLRNPSYLTDLKDKERRYGLRFHVQGLAQLSLPAYSGGFLFQHARPGE
jgi:uncharacterized protein YlxW (UPF0749 family)